MEIAIDELPVMSHMHYYIRIYGASAVNHVTYFLCCCPVIINNSSRIVCTLDFSWGWDDDVMASIDQKADEKDIDHFLGAVSKQYTLLMTTAISYNRKFLYLRPSCGVNNSALKLFDL